MKWVMAVFGAIIFEASSKMSRGNVRKPGSSTASSQSSVSVSATGPNAFAWTHAMGFAWGGDTPLTPVNNGLTGKPLVPGNNNLVVG